MAIRRTRDGQMAQVAELAAQIQRAEEQQESADRLVERVRASDALRHRDNVRITKDGSQHQVDDAWAAVDWCRSQLELLDAPPGGYDADALFEAAVNVAANTHLRRVMSRVESGEFGPQSALDSFSSRNLYGVIDRIIDPALPVVNRLMHGGEATPGAVEAIEAVPPVAVFLDMCRTAQAAPWVQHWRLRRLLVKSDLLDSVPQLDDSGLAGGAAHAPLTEQRTLLEFARLTNRLEANRELVAAAEANRQAVLGVWRKELGLAPAVPDESVWEQVDEVFNQQRGRVVNALRAAYDRASVALDVPQESTPGYRSSSVASRRLARAQSGLPQRTRRLPGLELRAGTDAGQSGT